MDRLLVKELAKLHSGKVIVGNIYGNVNPYIEWLKWLNYIPDFEKERIDELNKKKIAEFTDDEFEEISIKMKNKRMSEIFKIYGTLECSEENYMEVYDYMCNESIDKLMLSKLTKEELEYAKEEITRLSKLPKAELSKKIKEEQKEESYNKLSMIDSYILHQISNEYYKWSISNLDNRIDCEIQENNLMRTRSLENAKNNFI